MENHMFRSGLVKWLMLLTIVTLGIWAAVYPGAISTVTGLWLTLGVVVTSLLITAIRRQSAAPHSVGQILYDLENTKERK
jgi:hypothetical protein